MYERKKLKATKKEPTKKGKKSDLVAARRCGKELAITRPV